MRNNWTVCYGAIQHAYRPAVVAFLRRKFLDAFREDGQEQLRAVFGKGWQAMAERERDRRLRTDSRVEPEDCFDLLDVANFHNVFEARRPVLLPNVSDRQFREFLRRLDLVKAQRDAFSHPNAAPLPYRDAFTLLSEAESVLATLELPDAAAAIVDAQAGLSGSPRSQRMRSASDARKQRSPRFVGLAIAAAVLVGVVLAAVWLATRPPPDRPAGQSSTAAKSSGAPAVSTVVESSTATVPTVPPSCPEPCCGGSLCKASPGAPASSCCPSGRDCVAGPCAAALTKDRRVVVRLGRVLRRDTKSGEVAELSSTEPHAHVRLTLRGSPKRWSRIPLANRNSAAGLEVSVTELVRQGLRIEVQQLKRVAYEPLAVAADAPIPKGVYYEHLCAGYAYPGRLFKGSIFIQELQVFLDEPGSPPTKRCETEAARRP